MLTISQIYKAVVTSPSLFSFMLTIKQIYEGIESYREAVAIIWGPVFN